MSWNSFITLAEFSSQSLFLILVLDERYLLSGCILVANVKLRRRADQHSWLLSSPPSTFNSLTTHIAQFVAHVACSFVHNLVIGNISEEYVPR